jgi:GxxExxY protein
MSENALSRLILDSAFRVHSALRPGLFEHVYEVTLAYELRKQSLEVARQVPIPIVYDGLVFEEGYRADLVVEQSIIVEVKSVETVLPIHWKQLYTQLKLKEFRLGLLINFGDEHLKNGIRRIANNLSSVLLRPSLCVPSRTFARGLNLLTFARGGAKAQPRPPG